MAHTSSPPSGPHEVTARKSEMKPKGPSTLNEISVRKEAKGFTVRESYNQRDTLMSYHEPKTFAFSTDAETVTHLHAAMKRLGVKEASGEKREDFIRTRHA